MKAYLYQLIVTAILLSLLVGYVLLSAGGIVLPLVLIIGLPLARA